MEQQTKFKKKQYRMISVGALLALVFIFQNCGSQTSGTISQNITALKLQLYQTCGDPVCRKGGYRAKPGISPCTSQQVAGSACSQSGTQCDPYDDCNSLLECTDKAFTNCPI